MNWDNFITHQNIEHYRQLLKTTKDEIERKMILKLPVMLDVLVSDKIVPAHGLPSCSQARLF